MLAPELIFVLLTLYFTWIDGHPVADEGSLLLSKNCFYANGDESKIACLCNRQTDCDDLQFEWPKNRVEPHLIETTKSGRRFETSTLGGQRWLAFANDRGRRRDVRRKAVQSASAAGNQVTIKVDLRDKNQEILGWGGAFTDASGINIKSLTDGMDEKLLASYFGINGLQYNFGRVPMGGSDFSVRPYSYDDSTSVDYNLTSWSLAPEDLTYKIPVIKRAKKLASATTNATFKLFSAPWSPPKWMKDNNNVRRGHLIDSDAIYKSYAEYHIKFYKSYAEYGLDFWGGTVQNEPIEAFYPSYFFNSLELGNAQTIKFIAQYLGPLLEANGFTKDKFKLMVGDDNLGMINFQVPDVMRNEQASKYVSGLAFHWYNKDIVPYEALTQLLSAIQDKIQFHIMTEACIDTQGDPKAPAVDLGSWERGEQYAADIIQDLLRQTSAWIDWNLALDTRGGPNWANNFVDSPIIVDKIKNEFYKQPMYYVLAHFSRFLRPGTVRVGTKVDFGAQNKDVMAVAAFDKATGRIVVNILNKSSERRVIDMTIENLPSDTYVIPMFEVEGKSINTLIMVI